MPPYDLWMHGLIVTKTSLTKGLILSSLWIRCMRSAYEKSPTAPQVTVSSVISS